MNLDELKTAWREYDRKIQLSHAINEKIILRMISDRSTSRLGKIRREYLLSFIYMFAMLALFMCIFIWNPFDYTHIFQYTPTALQSTCILITLILLFNGQRDLRVDINQSNLDASLKTIIAVYEKAEKLLRWSGVSLMVSGLLFPLSFLPKALKSSGLWQGLGLVFIQVAVIFTLYVIVIKLGFLKDKKKYATRFKEDLNELEELKAMSAELQTGNEKQ